MKNIICTCGLFSQRKTVIITQCECRHLSSYHYVTIWFSLFLPKELLRILSDKFSIDKYNCLRLLAESLMADWGFFQATIVCDIIVLYMLKARQLYKDKKYLEVIGDDAYKVRDQ